MDEKTKQELEKENRDLRKMVDKLYATGIQILFSLKQITRIGALCGCYFWLGIKPAIALAIFIVLIFLFQKGINKLKLILEPKLKYAFNDWDFIDHKSYFT